MSDSLNSTTGVTSLDWSNDCAEYQLDGFVMRARIEGDSDTSPQDYDCYDDDEIAAYNDGRWGFVGLIVTAGRIVRQAGRVDTYIELGSSSLWGIDFHYDGASLDYLSELALGDVGFGAVSNARANMAQLCAGVS